MEASTDRDGRDADWHAIFALHVREHGRALFGLAYRVLGNAAAAEDVCQQALMKAWDRRRQVRDRQSLRGWLMRTVMNESLTLLRRAKVEARATEPQYTTPAPEPLALGEKVSLQESVAKAMLELPEPTRTIVAMRIMEGRPGAEVGRLVGYSEPEVSRRLHLGMNQLRESLRVWTE